MKISLNLELSVEDAQAVLSFLADRSKADEPAVKWLSGPELDAELAQADAEALIRAEIAEEIERQCVGAEAKVLTMLRAGEGDYDEHTLAQQVAGGKLRDPFAEPPKPVTEPGMYEHPDGTIIKAQRSASSGGMYAKRLTETGALVYEAGLIKFFDASMRMTVDRAKEVGRALGVCCVCSATLSDPVSVAAGIGPICAGRV